MPDPLQPLPPVRTMRALLRTIVVAVLVCLACNLEAASTHLLSKSNFQASVCNIERMDIEFTIDLAFGEPLIRSRMKWLAGPNTSPDCLPEVTFVHILVERSDGESAYIKLNPEVISASGEFGPTTTTSPSWESFFCASTSDYAECLDAGVARSMFNEQLAFESFQVVTNASIALSSSKPAARRNDDTAGINSLSAYDKLLLKMEQPPVDPVQPEQSSAPPERRTVTEQRFVGADSPEARAEKAVNEVVSLLSTPLAQYKSPSHTCESERRLVNWVRVLSTCQISFRKESTYQFLCGDDGTVEEIADSSQLSLDFSKHLERIGDLVYSDEGWVALTLKLKKNLASNSIGDYAVDRWEFTAATQVSDEMKSLAKNFAILKSHCEGSG